VFVRLIFLLIFIILPLVELFLLLAFAWLTESLFWTLLLVIVTGLLGYLLTRSQGLRIYHRIQSELSVGKVPTDALLDGMMVFLAGAFLLTPGILTDLAGFSLLIPWSRGYYRRLILSWFRSRFSWRHVVGGYSSPSGFNHQQSDFSTGAELDESVVEGTVVEADELDDDA